MAVVGCDATERAPAVVLEHVAEPSVKGRAVGTVQEIQPSPVDVEAICLNKWMEQVKSPAFDPATEVAEVAQLLVVPDECWCYRSHDQASRTPRVDVAPLDELLGLISQESGARGVGGVEVQIADLVETD